MFELDEMKGIWAAHDEKLDQIVRLNRELLNSASFLKARSATQRMILGLGFEAIMWFGIIACLGRFVFHHHAVVKFLVAGIALDVFSIAMLGANIRQIVSLMRIDYAEPVTTIQKQFEMLRVLRIRITVRALLGGTVIWTPFVIVIAQAFFGLNIATGPWLWTNVAFGLCLIPIALWLSKAFGQRMERFPFVQRIMNDLAGRNLKDALDSMSRLSSFELDGRS